MKHKIRPSHTFAIITALLIIIVIGAAVAWYWAHPNRGEPAMNNQTYTSSPGR